MKDTVEMTLSAEENAKRMEKFFMEAKQKEQAMNTEMKKKSDYHFKTSQELKNLRDQQKNLEAEINGCESTLKNLENRIKTLDHESLKQAEVIYTQVMQYEIILNYCNFNKRSNFLRIFIFNH